ncbi:hypothetical protein ACL90Y_11700 [Micrococcus luteus]
MEYLVPALAVVVIGALAAGAAVWLGRRPKPERSAASGAGPTGGVSAERAQHASSLLSEDQHRAVYGRIATNRPMEAITEYRRFTGRPLRESMMDVQSLAAHPQVYTLPQEPDPTAGGPVTEDDADAAETPAPAGTGHKDETPTGAPDADAEAADRTPEQSGAASASASGTDRPDPATSTAGAQGTGPDEVSHDGDAGPATAQGPARAEREPGAEGERPSSGSTEAGTADRHREDGLPSLPENLMVPAEWSAEPAPEDRPFAVEVMRGDGTVHLSSRDLPPWLRDQLAAMMRDGNLETAAVQLSTHTELSVPEAFELLRRIQESRGQ